MATLLSDKHKVSSSTESDNDELMTYPQGARFLVDKTENKFSANDDGLHAVSMEAVRYDGRAGGRGGERPAPSNIGATVPPPLSCKWRCIAFCAIAKKTEVVARIATGLVHGYGNAAYCGARLQTAQSVQAIRQIEPRPDMRP